VGTILSVLGIFLSHTVWAGFICQVAFGLAQGAVWPFASAWMLSFTNLEISQTTVLRYYNVSWTSGTAVGMYAAGVLGDCDHIYWAFTASMAILTISLVTAFPPESTPPLTLGSGESNRAPMGRISFAILAAAVIANIAVLGTRAITSFNYPELNQFHHFSETRIGLFSASTLGGQLAAFMAGRYYEYHLGSRRIYAIIAVCLIAINLCLAFVTRIEILMAAMILTGIVAAMAFQAAIIAATGWFSTPRIGTTVHESIIGAAQMVSWLGGWAIQFSKDSGSEPLTALRIPFLAMAVVVGAALILQMVLVTSRKPERILIPSRTVLEP
jgi:hypothetical protein